MSYCGYWGDVVCVPVEQGGGVVVVVNYSSSWYSVPLVVVAVTGPLHLHYCQHILLCHC